MQNTLTKSSKIIICIVCAILGCAIIAGIGVGIYFGVSTKTCSGVIVDDNNNPIQNVMVTDGHKFVKTDKNGRYEIKTWHKSKFITMTIPSGYWTEDYYILLDGSGEDYNFKLQKTNVDSTNHSFLQVTDTEVFGSSKYEPWLSEVKEQVAKQNPSFLIHTGDICYEDGLRGHIKQMNTETMGVPVRYVIGNHDYVKYGSYAEQLFEEIYGPCMYSFEVGNIHYIVTPLGWGDRKNVRYTKSDIAHWLVNDLENVSKDKKVVIFNHDALPGSDDGVMDIKTGGKKVNLKDYNVIAWVYGHVHHNNINNYDGILSITTAPTAFGGIDGTASAMRVVEIQKDKLSTHLEYIGKGEHNTEQGYIWQTQLSGRGAFADSILDGDNLYVATMSDSYPNESEVVCINKNTGEMVWKYKPNNSVLNNMALSSGKLVFQDAEGVVYCINAKDGEEVWKVDNLMPYTKHVTGSVVVDGDKVYTGDSMKIICRDINTGDVVWQNKLDYGERCAFKLTIKDNILYVSAFWRDFVALDKDTGKKLWHIDFERSSVTSSPYCYDGKVVVANGDMVYELDTKKGKVLRSKQLVFDKDGAQSSASAISSGALVRDGGLLYVPTYNGLFALDLATFDIKWRFEPEGEALTLTGEYASFDSKMVDCTTTIIGDSIVFGSSDGYVYSVDKKNGAKLDKFDIGGSVLSKIAYDRSSSRIYVTDFAGRVTCLQFDNGKFVKI